MRHGCFCLRPARNACHGVQKGSQEKGGSNGGTLEPSNGGTLETQTATAQQPVRAVSPADVRRTESGRVIRQRADARLRAIKELEASGGMRVLGGCQTVDCATIPGPLEGRAEGARVSAEVQKHRERAQAKRVLQPVNRPPTEGKQGKTLLQLLRPSRNNLQPDSTERARCKSIMEASETRLQRYKQDEVTSSAALQMAIIQTFSDAYLLAVSKGDQQWANATEIAASFSPDAVLKTQDKQTFYGKPAVLKRLNSGAPLSRRKVMV